MPLDLLIVYGSVRRDRQGIRAARFILNACRGRGHRATLIDPAVDQLPLLDRMYKEYEPGRAPEVLERLAGLIKAADAFIIVSGEYNHSIPPALSNLLDHFLEEYFWRPSAIVCYSAGAYGGVRAAMQLRALLSEAGMPAIPSLQPVPSIEKSLSKEGVALTQELAEKSGTFFDEFEWYMRAMKAERAKGVPY
jgi:NAD(P)H-dependent FMN reductase